MARHLDVVIGGNWAEFNGWMARERYTQLFRRPPVFNTRTRMWVTVPDKAAQLIASAEHEGWTVTVQRVEQSEEPSNALDSSPKGQRVGQFDSEALW